MWIQKVIFGFVLAASISGIAGAQSSAHAATTVPIPNRVQVENALGEKLAGDPRVMYPPTDVSCWIPSQTKHWFNYQCDAMVKTQTKHWRTVVDRMYGLHLKLYNDGSFTFTHKIVAVWTTVTRRYS